MSDGSATLRHKSILTFQWLSILALISAFVLFSLQIMILYNSAKKDIAEISEEILHWMFLLTAAYVIAPHLSLIVIGHQNLKPS